MFKQAIFSKWRISTKKGVLSAEQVTELSLKDLSEIIRNLKSELDKDLNTDDLSFLGEEVQKESPLKFSFDLVKEIYLTKKQAAENIKNAAETRKHNERILNLIASKEEANLQNKSIDELKSMLK